MRLFTGMWLTLATTGKPNAYLTICINSSDIILENLLVSTFKYGESEYLVFIFLINFLFLV